MTEEALRDALAESGWDLGPGEVAARELTGVLDGQQRQRFDRVLDTVRGLQPSLRTFHPPHRCRIVV